MKSEKYFFCINYNDEADAGGGGGVNDECDGDKNKIEMELLNVSSIQRGNPAPGGVLQVAPKQSCVPVQ